jgi:hypothetical protein
MGKRASDARISRRIRELLPVAAAPEFQGDRVGLGGTPLTYAEVIALECVKAAAAGKEWAIQMVPGHDRRQAGRHDQGRGRRPAVDERLDENLAKHLNGILGSDGGAHAPGERDDSEPGEEAGGPDRPEADAAEGAAGAAWADLDLPEDRDHDSEDL